MALEQEIAQQERVTKNGTSLRPADGPSEKWLARHFPPYRHSEGIGQQLGSFCATLQSFTGLKSPALARSVSRLRQGHVLFIALLWFTLMNKMNTLLLLTHRWSVLLGTNISVSDAQPQSLLYALPTVAIGHRRCSPFFELHNSGPEAPLTSVGTTSRQLPAQPGHLAHILVVKVLHVVPFRHDEHATPFLLGLRGILEFTLAMLHQKTLLRGIRGLALFRALRELLNSDGGTDTALLPPQGAHCRLPPHWTRTTFAAARPPSGQ